MPTIDTTRESKRYRRIAAFVLLLLTSQSAFGQVFLFDNTLDGPVDGPQLDPGDRYLAQPFLTGNFDNVSSVSVNLRRTAAPIGKLHLSIWDMDTSGAPGDLVGIVGDIDGASLPTSHEFVTLERPITGLTPNTPYFVVLDAIDAALPMRFGVLTSDVGTYGAGMVQIMLGDNWQTLDSVLGPHPTTGERANYWQMLVETSAAVKSEVALYDNMDLEPIENIPGAIGPRFGSRNEDLAQQFNMGEHNNVTSVSLFLNRVGSPSGEVAVEIWQEREPGVPSSLVSTIGTVDLSKLSDTPEEITFNSLVTGLDPNASSHVVLNNFGTSITSAQDSYRFGLLGQNDVEQSEGTNGAAYLVLSTPDEFNGAWTPLRDTLGCHPSGGCPNYLRMSVTAATLLGDFNENGVLDADDIDELSLQIRNGTNDRSFDLDNSATLNTTDHQKWVQELAGTRLGDADLDGVVEFPDFLALSAGFGQSGGWAQGDFDGNGNVDFPDFLALSANFGASNASAAAVPEPTGICLAAFGIVGFIGCRKRR